MILQNNLNLANQQIYPIAQVAQTNGIMPSYVINTNQIGQFQQPNASYGVRLYQNQNDNQFYLLAPLNNQLPMNNVFLLSNQGPQNNFIMPLMKTDSLGYVMIKNLNENSQSNFQGIGTGMAGGDRIFALPTSGENKCNFHVQGNNKADPYSH